MKGCTKDFSNILDSNRERVAFSIFWVLLYFQGYCYDMETRLILKPLF